MKVTFNSPNGFKVNSTQKNINNNQTNSISIQNTKSNFGTYSYALMPKINFTGVPPQREIPDKAAISEPNREVDYSSSKEELLTHLESLRNYKGKKKDITFKQSLDVAISALSLMQNMQLDYDSSEISQEMKKATYTSKSSNCTRESMYQDGKLITRTTTKKRLFMPQTVKEQYIYDSKKGIKEIRFVYGKKCEGNIHFEDGKLIGCKISDNKNDVHISIACDENNKPSRINFSNKKLRSEYTYDPNSNTWI